MLDVGNRLALGSIVVKRLGYGLQFSYPIPSVWKGIDAASPALRVVTRLFVVRLLLLVLVFVRV